MHFGVATGVATLLHFAEKASCRDNLVSVHMGVNICRDLDVCMAHEALGGPDVHTDFLEICAVSVTQIVWYEIICQWKRGDEFIAIYLRTHRNIEVTP